MTHIPPIAGPDDADGTAAVARHEGTARTPAPDAAAEQPVPVTDAAAEPPGPEATASDTTPDTAAAETSTASTGSTGSHAVTAEDLDHPLDQEERTEELRSCPGCGGLTGVGTYCEQCGTSVDAPEQAPDPASATSPTPAADPGSTGAPAGVVSSPPVPGAPDTRSGGMLVLGAPAMPAPAPTPPPEPDGPRCSCGGGFLDGYCEQCGAPQPGPRHHVEDPAADWIAGVTDVGVRHRANQDAMSLSVGSGRAALVVCDGVSSALRSEDASQAAADAAAAVLARATSTGVGVPSSVVPALASRLAAAADAAADAVAEVTDAVHAELAASGTALSPQANPSCTFVAAAIEGEHVVVGSVGDSRAYWFPDGEAAVRLTTDDSVAEERIALGTPRAEAETGPGAHTITRWLGIDSPDHAPRTSDVTVDRPGWLILCSDGLWNYASEADALGTVLAEVATATHSGTPSGTEDADGAPDPAALTRIDPLALARGLVTWANAQGGHDNITVIAARLHDERKAGTDG